MGELTKDGFQTKTQNEYFEEEKALYQKIDAEWSLDPATPDGLKLAHDSEVFGALDQLVKQAYDARDPNKATGRDLDVLRKLTGATRSQGTPTTVTLFMTGVASTLIPEGSQVKTPEGLIFTTDENLTLGTDGTGSVAATCTVNGANEVAAGKVNQIVTVVGGWQTVTNRTAAMTGTDAESDAVFRIKSARAVARAGSAQRDSLYGEIFDVDGVRKVKVYENKTNSSDVVALVNPYGLPPHSLAIIVDGGKEEAIARAIYRKVNPGVFLHAAGTKVEKTVWSEKYPNSYDVITFSRPIAVPITVKVKVADPSKTCPNATDLQEAIRTAIMQYYEGELLPDGIGFMTTGFDIGQSVPYSRLFTPVNKVLGIYVGSYVSEMTVNGGTSTVAIAFNQVSQFLRSNITVEIV